MSDNAIVVENLSKRYVVGHRTANGSRFKYVALRDVLSREAHNFIRKATDLVRGRPIVQGDEIEEFWALRDVNFEVKKGEVIGFIGRNGAGKSTLLKILSRITEPTHGRATLHGRVASLLEVGTGFHPELTGRENIFLNGAILGMSRKEIREKFDEIVAFAEVEQFLDMPVKHYSSGMYVRLAFAVAAHLEPEILIVDEVLAVGDAEFQKKCLGRIETLSRGGRTILFVSHNIPAVTALCQRAILLDRGAVIRSGAAIEIARFYHERFGSGQEEARVTTPDLRWTGLRNRSKLDAMRNDQDIIFELGFLSGPRDIHNLQIDIELTDEAGNTAVHCRASFIRTFVSMAKDTPFVVRYVISAPHLAPGHYYLTIYAATHAKELCWVEHIDACSISLINPAYPESMFDSAKGMVLPNFSIEFSAEPRAEYVNAV